MAVGNYKSAYLLCLEIVTIVVIAVALCTSVGCNSFNQTGTAKGQSIVGPFQGTEENPFLQKDKEEPGKRQDVVQINVYRLVISPENDASLGQFWSLLRPAQLINSDKDLLSRNGLEIAIGGAADWPKALSAIGLGPSQTEQSSLLKTDAPARLDQRLETWLAEGLMAELAIASQPGEQTLFWHKADGQLVGRSYEECHRLLVVTAETGPRSQIQLNVVPALKMTPPRLTGLHWMVEKRTGAQPEQRYASIFEELAFAVALNPNEFLAIGRSGQAGDASFAAAFFRAEPGQQPSTTVLLLVPKIMTDKASNKTEIR